MHNLNCTRNLGLFAVGDGDLPDSLLCFLYMDLLSL